MKKHNVTIIIPARNEAISIGNVIKEVPGKYRDHIFVIDSGSTDQTSTIAKALGVHVIINSIPTYDHACFMGAAQTALDRDILVFLHAGGDDDPKDIDALLEPIVVGRADMVMGTRTIHKNDTLLPHQRFGTKLVITLINIIFSQRFTDIGPFRAITRTSYVKLQMEPKGFSWTTQMLVKCLKLGFRVVEVPITSQKRMGKSKISGSIRYSLWAARDMLWSLRFAWV